MAPQTPKSSVARDESRPKKHRLASRDCRLENVEALYGSRGSWAPALTSVTQEPELPDRWMDGALFISRLNWPQWLAWWISPWGSGLWFFRTAPGQGTLESLPMLKEWTYIPQILLWRAGEAISPFYSVHNLPFPKGHFHRRGQVLWKTCSN